MNDTVVRSLTGSVNRPELTFRRRYRATVSEVRAAVTDPRRLARWFGDVEGDPTRVGDAFAVRLSEAPSVVAVGTVLSCAEDAVVVSWTWQGEPESVITARLETVSSEETDLVVVHELREAAHAAGYGGSWEQMLTALDRTLGGTGDACSDVEVEAAAVDRWGTLTRASLDVRRRVAAPVDQVWAAFASAEGLACWWWTHWADVRIEADVRVGGSYRIIAPSAGIVLTGRYLVVESCRRLAFTWEWAGSEDTTTDEAVDLTFTPDGPRGCLVSVRHTGPWPTDEPIESYRLGWESTLPALNRALSQGSSSG